MKPVQVVRREGDSDSLYAFRCGEYAITNYLDTLHFTFDVTRLMNRLMAKALAHPKNEAIVVYANSGDLPIVPLSEVIAECEKLKGQVPNTAFYVQSWVERSLDKVCATMMKRNPELAVMPTHEVTLDGFTIFFGGKINF